MLLSAVVLGALSLGAPARSGFIREVDPAAEYDYIIVGSGAGGSPLAARLATYGHSVLLIDAGTDETDSLLYRIPAMSLAASEAPSMSWNFFVNHYPDLERQRRDPKMTWTLRSGKEYIGSNPPRGAKPKGIFYPRAGTLGGCTAHNAIITAYPNDEDWEYIARLTGDWS
ncbi:GMC oxidoreductase [Hirsutella rhossiliensis]